MRRVQAGNAQGDGEYSSEAACNTAKPAPPAPTSVIAYVAAEHAGERRSRVCELIQAQDAGSKLR